MLNLGVKFTKKKSSPPLNSPAAANFFEVNAVMRVNLTKIKKGV